MNNNWKKLIAPVIITVVVCLYFIGFAALGMKDAFAWPAKLAGVAIPLILAGVSIYVLIERIKEIRSGEEDDLSQY